MYPSDLLYSREHEWARINGDVVTIGITEFAQRELGEIIFVELPQVGQTFDSGDKIGTIESVKAVTEIYTPYSGQIVEINGALGGSPELLNDDPHGDGWLVKIRSNLGGAASLGLINSEAYEEYLRSGE